MLAASRGRELMSSAGHVDRLDRLCDRLSFASTPRILTHGSATAIRSRCATDPSQTASLTVISASRMETLPDSRGVGVRREHARILVRRPQHELVRVRKHLSLDTTSHAHQLQIGYRRLDRHAGALPSATASRRLRSIRQSFIAGYRRAESTARPVDPISRASSSRPKRASGDSGARSTKIGVTSA